MTEEREPCACGNGYGTGDDRRCSACRRAGRPDTSAKLSPRALEALRTLLRMGATPSNLRGTTGGPFSRLYWPEAWAAARTTDRRHGLRMRGGSMLADLVRRGWCEPAEGDGHNAGYRLSARGHARALNLEPAR